MYHIKNDQRSIRSADTIYEAVIGLTKEIPFGKITISQIVQRGQIGRSTFYRNFDSIEDVLRWRCDTVLQELETYVLGYIQTHRGEGKFPLVQPALRYFYLNSEIIEVLIAANRTDILQTAFRERMIMFLPQQKWKTLALKDH